MKNSSVDRRKFSTITAAAFSGLMAGAGVVKADEHEGEEHEGGEHKHGKKDGKLKVDPAHLLKEPHVCKGLNTCKGQGKGGDNACKGQGTCAVVDAHSCHGENACKGQGGCGGYPGQNTCKGLGHCAVPLKKDTWAVARKQLEHLMKDMDQKLGKAPS